jgi:hypothetical protein
MRRVVLTWEHCGAAVKLSRVGWRRSVPEYGSRRLRSWLKLEAEAPGVVRLSGSGLMLTSPS